MRDRFTAAQLQTMAQQIVTATVFVAIGGAILQHWLSVVWLLVGGLIGIGLWWLDELVGLHYYRRNEQDTELITRSPLFIVVFAVIALFVVTSTDQHIGFGVIWGLSAGLLVEGWRYAAQPTAFVERFFGMLSRNTALELNQTQTTQIVTGTSAFVVLLLILWVLRLT
jgi:hypothetical protein